jgi:hypothetical protein
MSRYSLINDLLFSERNPLWSRFLSCHLLSTLTENNRLHYKLLICTTGVPENFGASACGLREEPALLLISRLAVAGNIEDNRLYEGHLLSTTLVIGGTPRRVDSLIDNCCPHSPEPTFCTFRYTCKSLTFILDVSSDFFLCLAFAVGDHRGRQTACRVIFSTMSLRPGKRPISGRAWRDGTIA